MAKKMPKGSESAEQKREPEGESSSSLSWAQRHGGLVFLMIVSGIIGLALIYEFLKH